MHELATTPGSDPSDVDLGQNERFMKERMQAYVPVATWMGLLKRDAQLV